MTHELSLSHQAEIDRLYALLQRRVDVLHAEYGHLPTPGDLPAKRDGWRTKGVYFVFEPGEIRSNNAGLRVVRVGSHSGQTSSIESRIVGEHAKDWGRSRLRMQVGAALLRKGKFDRHIDPADRNGWVEEWYRHIPAKRGRGKFGVHDRPKELHPTLHGLHSMVTRTIANMNIVWVEIPDKDQRLRLEKQCIMLLSNYHRQQTPIDPSSDLWLGNHAREEEIRASGVWNVQHVKKPHTPGFLDDYEKYFR